MPPNPHFPTDLVTFTEEILNGKLQFLCSAYVDAVKDNKTNIFIIGDSHVRIIDR